MATRMSIEMKAPARLKRAMGRGAVQSSLRRHIRRATALNALAAQREIRQVIQGGSFEANAALTAAIKGSSKPLVDKGDLFKSITHMVKDDFTAFAGVMRTDDHFNIALALHEGFEAKVTPAMRGLFFVLWQASTGNISPGDLNGRAAELFERFQDWRPLKNETTAIITPSRPFVDAAFRSAGLKSVATKNWNMALTRVFRDIKRQTESGR